ncbi:MAG: ATP-grasp domain-containing protein [Alphaproteobacteria bacterium]
MPDTVLLTLGRLPKGLDLARSFRRAGYRVIVADPFRWHLMRVSRAVSRSYLVTAPNVDAERYLNELERIIRRENVSIVVPVSEESIYVAALKERLGSSVDIYGMSQETLLALHDKLRFIETAAAIGLSVPETYRLDDPRAGRLAETGDYVLKPINACAGRGVRIEKQGTALPDGTTGTSTVVQRHVEGWAASSFSMTHEGRVMLTVVYRGTIMSGTVAVGFERVDKRTGIEEWVDTFVAHIGYSGFIAFDFIIDRDGKPFAIECNPRATSGLHFVATDILAPMMLYPNRATPPRLRVDRQFQQFWPCLTETQARILCWPDFWRHLKSLCRSRDVTWRRRDPLPFLLMPFTSMKMFWTAMTTEKSLGEAATDDIEWVPLAERPSDVGSAPGPTETATDI